MTGEIALYATELKHLLDRLCAAIEGLDEAQLNWRPPLPDANSVYVIATHVLGNAEAWVLGIACGLPVERDRPAEFAAAGAETASLVARARELSRRIEEALSALPPKALDEPREPSPSLWGEGTPRPVTVGEALMHVVEHAATHLGQIDITRDLVLAGRRT